MMEGFGEIMTLEETAKYLKIGKSTLYKMARENEDIKKYLYYMVEKKNI